MFRLYFAWLKLALLSQAQYRTALFIWLLHRLIEPLIYLTIWSAVAQSNGGSVGDYGIDCFSSYYIAGLVVSHLTYTWHIGWYDYLIRSGELSELLLRPVHPIHGDIVDNLASKLLTVLVMLPTIAGLMIIYQVRFRWSYWLFFLIAVSLAFALRFTLEYLIGLLAFWTTRLTSISKFYYTAMTFFSGQLAPLPLLPSFLQNLALWLPFYWMFGFPIEVLIGQADHHEMLCGFAMQLALILCNAIGICFLWERGTQRYTAAGN
jgi:ABC-2 type transport system permease protein